MCVIQYHLDIPHVHSHRTWSRLNRFHFHQEMLINRTGKSGTCCVPNYHEQK